MHCLPSGERLGNAVGPDLSAAGLLPAEQLQATILNPNQSGAGAGRGGATGPGRGNGRGGRGGRAGVRPAAITVRTLGGEEYRGIRRNEDVFSLQMVDLNGNLRLLDKSNLAEIRVETKSLMPDDYSSRLAAR